MRWNIILAAVGAAVVAVGHSVGGGVGEALAVVGGLVTGLAGPQVPRRK